MTDRDRILWIYSMEFVYLFVVPSPAGILIYIYFIFMYIIFLSIQRVFEIFGYIQKGNLFSMGIMSILFCSLLNKLFLHLTTIM